MGFLLAKRIPSRCHSAGRAVLHRRLSQRGLMQALMLIVVILSLSMWGVSSILQRVAEQDNQAHAKSEKALNEIADEAISFATVPPPYVTFHESEFEARYNFLRTFTGADVFDNPGRNLFFRYFTLPCPVAADGAGVDVDLDGVSNSLANDCDGGGTVPLADDSRFGRLPWREFRSYEGTGSTLTLEFVRGLLSEDKRDGYGERFWYVVSNNSVDRDAPMSGHALLRLTTGWITVKNEEGEVISDRVAAAFIAPGAYGIGDSGSKRIPEQTPQDVITVASADVSIFHKSYLDESTYGQLAAGVAEITIRNDNNDISADKIKFITIEDLASQDGPGVKKIGDVGEGAEALLEPAEDRIGLVEMFEEHLNRFGYLVKPAGFTKNNATAFLSARPGTLSHHSARTPGTFSPSRVDDGGLETDLSSSVRVTAVFLAKKLPAVLVDDDPITISSVASISLRTVPQPPYNIALVDMETNLNYNGIGSAVRTDYEADGHIYIEVAGGVTTRKPYGIPNDSTEVIHIAKVLEQKVARQGRLNFFTTYSIEGGATDELTVRLTEPVEAFLLTSQLGDAVTSKAAVATVDTGGLPPYGVRVIIPAGTKVPLRIADYNIALPIEAADIASNSDLSGLVNGTAQIDLDNFRVYFEPVSASIIITLTAVATDLNVVPGNIGWLPVVFNNLEGRTDRPAYAGYAAGTYIEVMGGGRSRENTAPLGAHDYVSRLSVPLTIRLSAQVTVFPFAPPGMPETHGSLAVSITVFPTPFLMTTGQEVELPVGTHLVYPPNINISVGKDFAIPANTRIFFPPYATVTGRFLENSNYPDGRPLGNSGAEDDIRAVLSNGGFVALDGGGAKPVIPPSSYLSAAEHFFSMENLDGLVYRPFIGRQYHPLIIDLEDDDELVSSVPIPAKFSTRTNVYDPRYGLVLISNIFSPVGFSAWRKIDPPASSSGVNATVTSLLTENARFILPANTAITLTLVEHVIETVSITVAGDNPDAYAGIVTAASIIVLPVSTHFYDSSNPLIGMQAFESEVELGEHLILGADLRVTLLGVHTTDTRTNRPLVMKSHLLMFPVADMTIQRSGGNVIIPANSIIDYTEGKVYTPWSLAKIPMVPEKRRLVSNETMYVYMTSGVSISWSSSRGLFRRNFWLSHAAANHPDSWWQALTVLYPDMGSGQNGEVRFGWVHFPGLAAGTSGTTAITTDLIAQNDATSLEPGGPPPLPGPLVFSIPPGGRLDFFDRHRSRQQEISIILNASDLRPLSPKDHAFLPPGSNLLAYHANVTMYSPISAAPFQESTTVAAPSYINIGSINERRDETAPYRFREAGFVGGDTSPSYHRMMVLLNDRAYIDQTATEEIWDPLDFEGRKDWWDIFDPVAGISINYEPIFDWPAYAADIPPHARFDYHGYMYLRSDFGYRRDLMSYDTRALLQDYPVVYAVAEECLPGNTDGVNCAEGEGEGLTFSMGAGEEYVLQEPLNAPDAVLLTTVLGDKITILQGDVDSFGSSTDEVDAIFIGADGDVVFAGGSDPGNNDRVIVYASDRLRAYFGVATLTSALDGLSYAEITESFTIYVGGFVKDNYALAAGGFGIPAGTGLTLGAGTKINGVAEAENIFGFGSMVDLGGGDEFDLHDYVVVNYTDLRITTQSNAHHTHVNPIGLTRWEKLAGEPITMVAAGSTLTITASPPARFTVAAGAEITMEDGYLWQGYIPRREMTLELITNAHVSTYTLPGGANNPYSDGTGTDWPPAKSYLRVQTTITAFNFWGSGLERPEGLDGNSDVYTAVNPSVPGGSHVDNEPALTVDSLPVVINDFDATRTIGYFATATADISIVLRVHNADGSSTVVVADWTPQAVVITVNAAGNVSTTVTTAPALRWNYRQHPFRAGPIGLAYATVATAPIFAGGRNRDIPEDNSYIDNFQCNLSTVPTGAPAGVVPGPVDASVNFNPPLIPLQASSDVPVRAAWDLVSVNIEPSAAYETAARDGLPTDGTGTGTTLIPPLRPDYFPTNTFDNLSVRYDAGMSTVAVNDSSSSVTLHTDLFFFIDRAFHTDGNIPGFAITQRVLEFGDDFVIEGPAAIVPPFGGQTRSAVENVLGSRSAMFAELFGTDPLSTTYSAKTGDCVGTDDCSALFDTANKNWLPILNGVVAMDMGAAATLSRGHSALTPLGVDDAVRIILPQPTAEVTNSDGILVTIHAGSHIYPELGLIYPSTPIDAAHDYTLVVPSGGVVAAIDVSPAISPRAKFLRQEPTGKVAGEKFNMVALSVQARSITVNTTPVPPVTTTLVTAHCIVEPIAFVQENLFDSVPTMTIEFTVTLAGVVVVSTTQFTTSFTVAEADQFMATLGYDASFARGFVYATNYPAGETDSLIERYQRGFTVFNQTSFVEPSATGTYIDPITGRAAVLFTDIENTDLELGHPLSHRWLVPTPAYNYFNLGAERFGSATTPDPYAPVGLTVSLVGNPYKAIRLAHRIDFAIGTAGIAINSFTVGNEYSIVDTSRRFTFPSGTKAAMLNSDAGSWAAANPVFARYLSLPHAASSGNIIDGIEIVNNNIPPGSTTPETVTIGLPEEVITAITTTVILSNSGGTPTATITVADISISFNQNNNDGYRIEDISGYRLLSYLRAERQEGMAPYSFAPIFTNMWIRLEQGGELISGTGDTIELPPNSIINPVLGTYFIPPQEDTIIYASPDVVLSKSSAAGTVGAAITVVRAAYQLPKGTKIFIGENGATLSNVKAVAMFSLTALEQTQCPSGEPDLMVGQAGATVAISQIHEGVSESKYTEQSLDLGHPCLWLDDPENLDGDNLFVYRSRRRYFDEPIRIRTVSNDRTYTFGGKLVLN